MNDEHTHEWGMDYQGAICIHAQCSGELNLREIERRLNAVECLDRTQAMLLAGVLKTEFGDRASVFREYLLSYSKALEGEE